MTAVQHLLLVLACSGDPATDGPTGGDSDSTPGDSVDTAPILAGDDFALFTSSAELKAYLNEDYALPTEVSTTQSVGQVGDWTALADFDGDGLDDFWQIDDSGNKVRIHMNLGDGTWESEHSFDPTSGTGTKRPAIAGDFNGDGRDDMMLLNTTSGRAIMFPNVVGMFDTEDEKVANPTELGEIGDFGSGDMDGDGTDDLIQMAGSDVTIWKVVDGVIDETAPLMELNIPGGVQGLGIDIDDDGDTDLAIWSGSTVTVYSNVDGVIDTDNGVASFLNASGTALAGQIR